MATITPSQLAAARQQFFDAVQELSGLTTRQPAGQDRSARAAAPGQAEVL